MTKADIDNTASTLPGKALDLTSLMEGDVVIYRITAKEKETAAKEGRKEDRVLGIGVITGEGNVHALCQREEGSNEHFIDEDQDAIPGKILIE